MDSGNLLSKGLDKTELRVEHWLDIVAMVVMIGDCIRKEGHMRRKCDSGLGKSARQNSQQSLWTREWSRKRLRRDTRRGRGNWRRTARTFGDSYLGNR